MAAKKKPTSRKSREISVEDAHRIIEEDRDRRLTGFSRAVRKAQLEFSCGFRIRDLEGGSMAMVPVPLDPRKPVATSELLGVEEPEEPSN